jgi:hypothetical protein
MKYRAISTEENEMPGPRIKHRRTSRAWTTCKGRDIYMIKLSDTKYSVRAGMGDTLGFRRIGDDNQAGFDVTIEPAFSSGGSFSTTTTTLDIPVPAGQADGEYKYTISYPNDPGVKVVPLDPIIIIDPPLYRRMFSVLLATVISFAVGATFGMYIM